MADMLTENDEAEELIITETRPETVEDVKTVEAHDDDDDDIDPDAPDKTAKSEDETEVIRERRRKEKLERKERREKAIHRDKLELDFLRKRNDALERSVSEIQQRQKQADVSQVDLRLREVTNEITMAEKVIAKAVEAGNGEDVAQAMRYRDEALRKANELTQLKQRATQEAQRKPSNTLDDMTAHYAQEFIKENSWYDPQGRDEDSAIVMAIDQSLAREGLSPQTAEYWDKLREKVAKRLPDRVAGASPTKADTPHREARGGPAVGSGKEHAPVSTRTQVYISPERKQALVDAGVWDDPVLRMKYVKRYAEYDKSNRA